MQMVTIDFSPLQFLQRMHKSENDLLYCRLRRMQENTGIPGALQKADAAKCAQKLKNVWKIQGQRGWKKYAL